VLVKQGFELLEVFDQRRAQIGIVQAGSGVVDGHVQDAVALKGAAMDFADGGFGIEQLQDAVALKGAAMDFADGGFGIEQRLGGRATQRTDDLGVDRCDLPVKVVATSTDLVGSGVAILRSAALDDICDEDLVAAQTSIVE